MFRHTWLFLLILSVIAMSPAFAQEGDPEGFDAPAAPLAAPNAPAPTFPANPSSPAPYAAPTATFDPSQPAVPFDAGQPGMPASPQATPPQFVSPQGLPFDPAQQGDNATTPNASPELTKDPGKYGQEAELRALNKVTTRTEILRGPLGTPMSFGNLEITVKTCWSAGVDKRPEHAALMDVVEQVPGEGPKAVFSGWMYASSPSLSAMEHAVYDITVLACHDKKTDADKKEADKKDKDAKKKDESKKAGDKKSDKKSDKKPSNKKPLGKKPAPAAGKAPPPIPPVAPVTGVLRLPPGAPAN